MGSGRSCSPNGAQIAFGDPQAALPAVLKVIDAEPPPLRVFLGTEGMPVARAAFAERLALSEAAVGAVIETRAH